MASRSWAEALLDPIEMEVQGYLRPEPIQRLWRQHLSGRFDHTARLWTVLMWQAWLAEWHETNSHLTRNGLLEPLGQSQILPYTEGLVLYCFDHAGQL